MMLRILGPIAQLPCVGVALGESLRSSGVIRPVDIFFTSNEYPELIAVPYLSETKRRLIITSVAQLLEPLKALDYTDRYPEELSFVSSLCDLHATDASLLKYERLLFDVYVARGFVRKYASSSLSSASFSSRNHDRLHAFLLTRLTAEVVHTIYQQAEQFVANTSSQLPNHRRALVFMQQVLECTPQHSLYNPSQSASSSMTSPTTTPRRFAYRTSYVKPDPLDSLSAAISNMNLGASPGSNSSPATPRTMPKTKPAAKKGSPSPFTSFHVPPVIDLSTTDTTLVILDIETTGLSSASDHIIQLAARIVYSGEISTLGPSFNAYIHTPEVKVSSFITNLTGITNEQLLKEGRPFPEVWRAFLQWISRHAQDRNVVWMAHNGKSFDFKFIHAMLKRQQIDVDYEQRLNIKCHLDTLHILRQPECWASPPSCHKLGVLYEHAMQAPLPNAHNALGDVDGVATILTEGVGDVWKVIANKFQFSISSFGEETI